jgi:hypothetical protein
MHPVMLETSGKSDYNNSLRCFVFDKGQYSNTERLLILPGTLVLDGP